MESKQLGVPLDPTRCEVLVDVDTSPPQVQMRLVVDDATALLLQSQQVFPEIDPERFLFEVRDVAIALTLSPREDVAERTSGRPSDHDVEDLANWVLERWDVIDAGADLPPLSGEREG